MNVHQVKCCTVHQPACSEEAFTAPLAFGKEVLRELCLLFDLDRFNVAGVNGLAVDSVKVERRKVPDLDIFD